MNKKVALLALLAIPIPTFTSGVLVPHFYVYSDVYGPFPKYAESTYLDLRITCSSIVRVKFQVGIYILNDEETEYLALHELGAMSFISGKFNDVRIKLLTENHLDENGMHIEFFFRDTNGNIAVSQKAVIYPYIPVRINPNHLEDYYMHGSYIWFNESLVVSEDIFVFPESMDMFLSPSYFKLDLEQFTFGYVSIKELTYASCYLRIKNVASCFKNLLEYSSDELLIPLRLEIKDYIVSLIFKNSYYVDPQTLLMSNYPQQGYYYSNYFFFPKNYKDEINRQIYTFEINDFSECHRSFIWRCEYSIDQNLIGDCFNSDFCITGDIL